MTIYLFLTNLKSHLKVVSFFFFLSCNLQNMLNKNPENEFITFLFKCLHLGKKRTTLVLKKILIYHYMSHGLYPLHIRNAGFSVNENSKER